MATEFADKRLVFKFLENITDKGAASYVTARNFIDRPNIFFSCERIADNDIPRYSC